jgi:hypothetical protein
MCGWIRRGGVWVTAVLVVLAGAGLMGLVLWPQPPDPPVASVMLGDQDVGAIEPGLPPGSSEASEEEIPLPDWVPPAVKDMVRVPGQLNRWATPDRNRIIAVAGYRLQLPVLASAAFGDIVERVADVASEEFPIVAVPGARGFVEKPGGRQRASRRYWGIFRQGALVFTVVVASAATDDRDLVLTQRLTQLQAAKGPGTPSVPAPPDEAELAARFAAGTLLVLLTYTSVASLLAVIADPLRGAHRLTASVGAPQPGHRSPRAVIDITSTANRQRRSARAQLAVELVGLAVAVPGLFPFTWPFGLAMIAAGVTVAGLPAVLARERRNPPSRPALSRPPHRGLPVAVHSALSALFVLVGLAGVLLYGIAAFAASQLFILNLLIAGIGLVLIAAGTLLRRHARRIAAFAAREALNADARPMVLYLRAFADDRLTLRSARYARPLLLDRLNPRGFDRFEETIVRSLTAVGPVVAVNPPGTRLAPLGAARDTLDSGAWQPQVARRIDDAALVVVAAAPQAPAPGLAWELAALDDRRRWSTTLLVLPPLPPDELRGRWRNFLSLLGGTALAGHDLQIDPAGILVATATPASGWTVITATRRDEWTYAAALSAAADRAIGHPRTHDPPI